MLVLRSTLFNSFMAITAIIIAIPALFLFPFSFRVRYAFISQWAKMNIWALGIICGLHYKIEGSENIPDSAVIVLSKHQSTWETLALQKIFREQAWLLKKELLRIPFFGWGLALTEPIAINRDSRKEAMQQLIKQGQERLDDNRCVVLFPEGTRIRAGKRGKYRQGGARLAISTGYPIIPMAHNAGEFWAKGSFIINPGVIRVKLGTPIQPNGKNSSELTTEVEKWIEEQMQEITNDKLKPITAI